jgi:hypothetical protein
MSRPGLRIAVTVLSGFVSAAAFAAPPVPVTACRQEVERAIGILTVDLDCSSDPLAIGVVLRNAKLDLNGHSITGAEIGVVCAEKCTIFGPGTISGNHSGIDQISLRPNGGKVTLKEATVTGNAGNGIAGDRVYVLESTISGNGGFIVQGNPAGGGIFATHRVAIRDSTVDGNETYGACSSGRISVTRSTLTGSGAAPGCVPHPSCDACGDVVTRKKPFVSRTSVCDVSANPLGGTWGVCSAD